MTKPTKTLLYDTGVEKQVLGCILLKPELLDDTALKPEDFFNQSHAAVFAKMQELQSHGKPIMPELLRDVIGKDWEATVGDILTSVGSPSHIKTYAKIVRDLALRRRLSDAGTFLVDHAGNREETPCAILDASEAMLSEIVFGSHETDPVSIGDAMLKAAGHIDAILQRGEASGVMTGLYDFDHDVGGLFPGELIILAARPGLGKTSLAMQISNHNANHGRLVYFASLEMSDVELSIRIACSLSGVSNRRVRTGRIKPDEAAKLTEAMGEQSKGKLVIHDQAGLTVNEIRRQIRRLKKRGLVLVVIDYLQLLTPSDRKVPREQQVAQMSKALKEIAREFSIPVLCLCQLNRQADGNEQPQLSHLRESGAIEQDADVVLFLAPKKDKKDLPANASLIIAKNRNGETNGISLKWIPSETRFECAVPMVEEWKP